MKRELKRSCTAYEPLEAFGYTDHPYEEGTETCDKLLLDVGKDKSYTDHPYEEGTETKFTCSSWGTAHTVTQTIPMKRELKPRTIRLLRESPSTVTQTIPMKRELKRSVIFPLFLARAGLHRPSL